MRRRSQQEAQDRLRLQSEPSVSLKPDADDGDMYSSVLQNEALCFDIKEIDLEIPEQVKGSIKEVGHYFHFIQDYLLQYQNKCIGENGIAVIVKRVGNQILSRGYSTTRVGVGHQDISKGRLRIALVPGVIREIRFKESDVRASYKTAFPSRSGDLLNLRDLEQGLEQIKRVSSQDVSMQIIPTDTIGESDVVLELKRIKPWKLTVTMDDSGAKSTGKLQAGMNLAIDNILGINDIFNLGLNTDADRKGPSRGTTGNNFFYSVPYGYWTYSINGSTSKYHQKIVGNYQTFVSSGDS